MKYSQNFLTGKLCLIFTKWKNEEERKAELAVAEKRDELIEININSNYTIFRQYAFVKDKETIKTTIHTHIKRQLAGLF